MKHSKRLEDQIGRLMLTLAKLNKEEVKELEKIKDIEKAENSILGRMRNVVGMRKLKLEKPAKPISHKERKKMNKHFTKKKPNKILEKVDNFLKGWKK